MSMGHLPLGISFILSRQPPCINQNPFSLNMLPPLFYPVYHRHANDENCHNTLFLLFLSITRVLQGRSLLKNGRNQTQNLPSPSQWDVGKLLDAKSATRNDSSLMQAPYPPAIHHYHSIWQRIRLTMVTRLTASIE